MVHAETDAARAQAAIAPYREHTETTSDGMVRVQTAKGDLTGQQLMAMVAGPGTSVGDARCTQRLRFTNATVPRYMPSALLCWRVSASRSVVTFAVAKSGKPSPELSASIINRTWAKL